MNTQISCVNTHISHYICANEQSLLFTIDAPTIYYIIYTKKKQLIRLPHAIRYIFPSCLIYLITLLGYWGTTDNFPTTPVHLILFSAALDDLAKSSPVHSLILFSHLFYCLPLLLFPFTILFHVFQIDCSLPYGERVQF